MCFQISGGMVFDSLTIRKIPQIPMLLSASLLFDFKSIFSFYVYLPNFAPKSRGLFSQIRFVHTYPFFYTDFLHQFPYKVEGNFIEFFKANTTFSHIQFLMGMFWIFIYKPIQ